MPGFSACPCGAIYTKANVGHIRQLGVLALAMAVLQMVLPLFSILLLDTALVDETSATLRKDGPDSLSLFITAGLILLASWIMEVGRRTSEEAEEMRREAELTV